jgi:hypothetical protein
MRKLLLQYVVLTAVSALVALAVLTSLAFAGG